MWPSQGKQMGDHREKAGAQGAVTTVQRGGGEFKRRKEVETRGEQQGGECPFHGHLGPPMHPILLRGSHGPFCYLRPPLLLGGVSGSLPTQPKASGFGGCQIAPYSFPFPPDTHPGSQHTCQEQSGGGWSGLTPAPLVRGHEFGFIIKESTACLHPFVQNYI